MPTISQNNSFKKSPICILSLSSKELFHSNMIGWLMENYIDFARLMLGIPRLTFTPKVEREKFNFDLLVSAQGSLYVIENKVKSLHEAAQIKKYQESIQLKKETATFILVSLISPGKNFFDELQYSNETDKNSVPLRVLNYKDVLDFLSEIKTINLYHEALIQDYIILITTLLSIKTKSEIFDKSECYAFGKEDELALRDIRLFDVAQKIRASCLAGMLDNALVGLNLPDYNLLKQKTEVALSNSTGLVSIKFGFRSNSENINLLLGIQIQGPQYRLSVESTDGSDVLEIAMRLKEAKLWLNPTDEHHGKAPILKFGKVFKYSYSSIKKIIVSELVDLVKRDVTRLFHEIENLESHCHITKRFINETTKN